MYIKNNPVSIGHPGIDYLEFLGVISNCLQPNLYFEIGTNTGLSLSRFTCDSVCVDPDFKIQNDVFRGKRTVSFFQMTSDEFFARPNIGYLFPNGIGIAFLDGLHRFESLLRDFMHTERYCHGRSVVLLHDCLPPTPDMADRYSATCINWTGDVWKLLLVLKKYRPDLRIIFLDCPPTGIVACTQLDPTSSIIDKNYYRILDEFGSMVLDSGTLQELWQLFPTLDTRLLREKSYDLSRFL